MVGWLTFLPLSANNLKITEFSPLLFSQISKKTKYFYWKRQHTNFFLKHESHVTLFFIFFEEKYGSCYKSNDIKIKNLLEFVFFLLVSNYSCYFIVSSMDLAHWLYSQLTLSIFSCDFLYENIGSRKAFAKCICKKKSAPFFFSVSTFSTVALLVFFQ